ncbi:T9SS type A sorting domain-containing protein, partial [Algoriphagus antarcticus]
FPVRITQVIYTAIDVAGNQSICSFNVTVTDDELPTVITRNRSFTIDQEDELILEASDIDDGSSDNCGIQSFGLSKTLFTAADEGENIVTLTITDVNGNQGFGQAIVTIIVNAIDPSDLDLDGDGFTPNQGDCHDSDDTIYPGAPELCDGKDNDCDGLIDGEDPDAVGLNTYFRDQDGDGYGDSASTIESCNMPVGYVINSDDCDDTDELINPGIPNSCDEPCDSQLTILSISSPLDPKPVYSKIKVSAMVVGSVEEAYWDWDDGTTTSVDNSGSGYNPRHKISTASSSKFNPSFNSHFFFSHYHDWNCDDDDSGYGAQHYYRKPGVYQPKLVVIDNCGNRIERLTDLVVIYHPFGFFVAGGGTFWSPKGAYTTNPNTEGRANFGFVAKSRYVGNKVDRNSEFQFKIDGLIFKSSSYTDMSLVLSGYKAVFKGRGSINGQSGYSFMISTIDSDKKYPFNKWYYKKADKIRIKIWKTATNEVVYGNEKGASDSKEATTNLTGGKVLVQSPFGHNWSVRESELIMVDWNTSKEALQDKLNKVEEELSGKTVVWDMNLYDPILEGVQFVGGLLKDSLSSVSSENIQASVLVLDKPAPIDIQLSAKLIPLNVRTGSVVGILQTVDPADDYHEYTIIENPNLYVEENRLIWKGGTVDMKSFSINVASKDIVGNVIEKDFTLSRENVPNTVRVYPNPASLETNVKIDFSTPSIVTLKMFDAAGRLVLEESGDYEKGFIRKIDLRELSNGLYQVQVQINFETITKRLIKVN